MPKFWTVIFFFFNHKWMLLCLVAQSCPALCNPIGCSAPGSSVHGVSSGKNTGMGCHSLLQGIFSTQRSNPGLPHCRRIFFFFFKPSEAPRKPKNTGVGSLYLLHGIFLTQESNQGLLHCPQILYQLSYQRSPKCILNFVKSFFSIY